jgi:hypothetical protein
VQLLGILTVPPQALAAPGAAAAPAAPIAVTPCLRIDGLPTASIATPSGAAPNAAPQQPGANAAETAAGDTLTIPPNATPGTVFHVIATVPANYPGADQMPLSVSLAISVH